MGTFLLCHSQQRTFSMGHSILSFTTLSMRMVGFFFPSGKDYMNFKQVKKKKSVSFQASHSFRNCVIFQFHIDLSISHIEKRQKLFHMITCYFYISICTSVFFFFIKLWKILEIHLSMFFPHFNVFKISVYYCQCTQW